MKVRMPSKPELWDKVVKLADRINRTEKRVRVLRMPKLYLECMDGCTVVSMILETWDEYTPYLLVRVYGPRFYGWKDRLQNIWWILRYGHPYGDKILLDLEAARSLAIRILKESDKGFAIQKEAMEQDGQ